MNGEELRRLKHELRTPVNHILGYSSLVSETADDEGDDIAAILARDIHASALILARLLEKSFLSTEEMGDVQMEALGNSILPVLKGILDTLASNQRGSRVASLDADLDRIRRAAHRLMVLVEPEKVPSPQSPTASAADVCRAAPRAVPTSAGER